MITTQIYVIYIILGFTAFSATGIFMAYCAIRDRQPVDAAIGGFIGGLSFALALAFVSRL